MKSSKRLILPVGLVIAFIILMIVLMVFSAIWVVHMFTNPGADRWFCEPIKDVVIDYLREAEEIEGKIQVNDFGYTNFDLQKAEENRDREDKEFPFDAVVAIAETRNCKYAVYLVVDENGELQVEKHEKYSHHNPFL